MASARDVRRESRQAWVTLFSPFSPAVESPLLQHDRESRRPEGSRGGSSNLVPRGRRGRQALQAWRCLFVFSCPARMRDGDAAGWAAQLIGGVICGPGMVGKCAPPTR